MKNLLQTLAVVFIFSIPVSVRAQGQLELVIRNIKEPKGSIRVGLFKSEDSFLKVAAVGKVLKASGKEVILIIENLKPGEYAVSIIHDENENGELDSNVVGIPKEGFAFGNNAMGMFGPPSFEKAKLIIEDGKKVTQIISIKYL